MKHFGKQSRWKLTIYFLKLFSVFTFKYNLFQHPISFNLFLNLIFFIFFLIFAYHNYWFVKDIHDAGGYVKISFGGVTYGTPGETLDEAGLDLLVQRIVNLIADYDLDGVDLTLVSLSRVIKKIFI